MRSMKNTKKNKNKNKNHRSLEQTSAVVERNAVRTYARTYVRVHYTPRPPIFQTNDEISGIAPIYTPHASNILLIEEQLAARQRRFGGQTPIFRALDFSSISVSQVSIYFPYYRMNKASSDDRCGFKQLVSRAKAVFHSKIIIRYISRAGR